jgi:serine/threonine protein kinase
MTESDLSYNSRYIFRERLKQRILPHFEVYRATQDGLERDVEVRIFKIKSRKGKAPAIKRFKREYKILARLDHPNIIKILDLGTKLDQAYYVTDLRNSKSIDEIQKEGKTLFEASEVLKMGMEIGKALEYIHKRDLLHRDISIHNVFYDNDNDFFYIGSFSQGKEFFDKDITSKGVPFISPLIATPEVLLDLPVDKRTDIYLLGQLMYGLLTGKKQAAHYNDFEKEALDVTSLDARPVLEYNPQVPQSVDILVRRMICIQPDKRFQNCQDFLKELLSVQRKLMSIQTIRLNKQEMIRQNSKNLSHARIPAKEQKCGSSSEIKTSSDVPKESPLSFRNYYEILCELPGSLKYALGLSLTPFLATAIFVYLSSSESAPEQMSNGGYSSSKPSESAYFGKVGVSRLTEILALKDKTTEENFQLRYDILAEYRRSFPHKDRKNIVSYNELIESRVVFCKDPSAGCRIIDKIIESLRARAK